MATSNSTRVNDIVINRTTEELLKTMEIQPNQFYLTPDDNTSGGSASNNLSVGKLIDLAYSDRLDTLTYAVNEEQNEDRLKAFFTTHNKAGNHRMLTGILSYDSVGTGTINSQLSPNDLCLQSMQLQLLLWIALSYKQDDMTAITSWEEVDCFGVLDLGTAAALGHIQDWNFIKLNNSIIKWRIIKVNESGTDIKMISFVIQLNSMQYSISLPFTYMDDIDAKELIRVNQTVALTNSLRAIETNIYNIGASNGGFAAGKDAALAFTREPAEGETLNANDWINAIQLGAGTNNVEKTLQVYDYQLMDANGKIPNERLSFDPLTKVDVIRSVSNDGDDTDIQYYKVINNQEHVQLGFYSGNSEEFLSATKRIKAIGIADNIAISMVDDMEAGDAVKASVIDIDYGTMTLNTMNGDINISAQNGAVAINSVGSDVGIVTDTGNFVWNGKQVAVVDDIPMVLDLSNQTIVG